MLSEPVLITISTAYRSPLHKGQQQSQCLLSERFDNRVQEGVWCHLLSERLYNKSPQRVCDVTCKGKLAELSPAVGALSVHFPQYRCIGCWNFLWREQQMVTSKLCFMIITMILECCVPGCTTRDSCSSFGTTKTQDHLEGGAYIRTVSLVDCVRTVPYMYM